MSERRSSPTRNLIIAAIAAAFAFTSGNRSAIAATAAVGDKLLNVDRDSEPWSPPRYARNPTRPQVAALNTTGAPTQNKTESRPRSSSAAELTAAAPVSVAATTACACKPSKQDLNAQLGPSVQHGFDLARRGALFAARLQFVQVLRGVAESRDVESGGNEHSVALAAGLRALEESEDFVPHGGAVEAELDMRIAASSHRTPVLGVHPENTAPRDGVILYHRYAQEQLGRAVAGEQVGSMALYGLGRIATRWAESNKADGISAQTQITMFAAAVAACPVNSLAANELGVCLCQSGRADEAAKLFERAVKTTPSSTAYHNLAVSQQKLGMTNEAAANEQESQRLAATERAAGAAAREVGVQWLSPAEMSGVGQSTEFAAVAAPPPSKWQKVVRMAKSLSLTSHKEAPAPAASQQSAPAPLPEAQSQSFLR
jgi:tetratricopeptide (TPR) repeat protein